jgi:hypothetical protein
MQSWLKQLLLCSVMAMLVVLCKPLKLLLLLLLLVLVLRMMLPSNQPPIAVEAYLSWFCSLPPPRM